MQCAISLNKSGCFPANVPHSNETGLRTKLYGFCSHLVSQDPTLAAASPLSPLFLTLLWSARARILHPPPHVCTSSSAPSFPHTPGAGDGHPLCAWHQDPTGAPACDGICEQGPCFPHLTPSPLVPGERQHLRVSGPRAEVCRGSRGAELVR